MTITAIAISAFVHGSLNMQRGDEAEFTEPTFTALAAHGLVRAKGDDGAAGAIQQPIRNTRAARTPSNKRAPDLANKTAASGEVVTAGGTPAPGGAGATQTADAADQPDAGANGTDGTGSAITTAVVATHGAADT